MATERVFITGGTGRIGTKCINDLLEKNIPVTVFARSTEKVNSLFPNHADLLNVIEGSFEDLSLLQEGLKGHTRLLMLVPPAPTIGHIKGTIAKYAFEAGVKQIVDISSSTIDLGWRASPIGEAHLSGEKAILDVPNRGFVVALRPTRFMSNHFNGVNNVIDDVIYDSANPDHLEGWISPNDIGAFAAAIFQDDIYKHLDKVYYLQGELVSGNQRAEIFSRLTGRKVTYVQDALKRYNLIREVAQYPHFIAIDLVDSCNNYDVPVSASIEIMLGRKPESLEQYLLTQKHLIN